MATRIPIKAVFTINGKQVENNFYALGRVVRKLRGELKQAVVGTKEFQEKAAELKKSRSSF